MPDKLRLYVINKLSEREIWFFISNKEWTTEILDCHFFTKEKLAYEEMDKIAMKSTTMSVEAVELAVD